MRPNRRKFIRLAFLGAGLSAGGLGYWLSTSERRAARWIRRITADSARQILPAPKVPEVERWSSNDISIAWLGHATVLINFYGITILTDPAFGSRIGFSLGLGTAGPKRYVAPALEIDQLPPIDILLLSHAHMDHFDLPSLRSFPRDTFTVTADRTADLASAAGLKDIHELRWNDRKVFRNGMGELEISAFEVKHWGRRWPNEKERGYNGYVLRREGKSLIFGGDTAHTPHFASLRSRGPHDVAIMPIGAYEPWIWNHCTPEEAFEMANDAGAHYVVPIHHHTFSLSREPMNEPIQRLEAAMAREPERLAIREIGGTFVVPEA